VVRVEVVEVRSVVDEVTARVDEVAARVDEVAAREELEELPPVPPELKVLPMGPNLMLEKMTLEFGTDASISEGTPEVVAQAPRAAPGAVEVVG
jgi:hypothetical protein